MVNFHSVPLPARQRAESVAVQQKTVWRVLVTSSTIWRWALLITQRSQVQILPPLPNFAVRQMHISGGPCSFPTHPGGGRSTPAALVGRRRANGGRRFRHFGNTGAELGGCLSG